MDYDLIIKAIKDGLTGNDETDLPYLMSQIEKYKDDRYTKEVTRDCVKMISEIIARIRKKETLLDLQEEDKKLAETLKEADSLEQKKDYENALELMTALVNKVESFDITKTYESDAGCLYYNFNEIFESILFKHLNKPEKEVRLTGIPYALIYFRYGILLIEMKRYEEAKKALEKAMRWNPVSADIAFQYNELFKISGDWENFLNETRKTFRIAFKPNHYARCYCSMGYYFIEKKMWKEAIICYLFALQFDPDNKNYESELLHIYQNSGEKVVKPELSDIVNVSTKYGFPLGADQNILSLLFVNGSYFKKNKKYAEAKDLLAIYCSLTHDEEVRKMLDEMPDA